MNADDIRAVIAGLLVLIGVALGFFVGRQYEASLTVPEDTSFAPEVIQGDGSVILERDPDPSPSPPPHQLPAGAIEERRVTVQLQPTSPPADTQGTTASKPIGLTLSLIQVDGGRRVVGSADGAEIVGGLDIPILPTDLARRFDWAAGASYDPFNETGGVWVDRDIERIRVGADLYQDRSGSELGMGIRLRVGWRF